MSRVVLKLFGSFEAIVDGVPIRKLRTQKGRWLLALLALREGRPVERGWVAATLWPENEPSAGLYSLRRALTDLRDALGSAGSFVHSSTASSLALDMSEIECDIAQFDSAIRRKDWRAATEIYTEPLLPECHEAWILPERDRRAEECRDALLTLAAENPTDRIGAYSRLLSQDPLNERALEGLIESYAEAGRTEDARRAFRNYSRKLESEIGRQPSEGLHRLLERVAPARPAEPPILKVGALPRFTDSLVGRRAEIQEIRSALQHPAPVTLVGPGGVGKTRLATHVAEEVRADFPDGVWFVHLAETRSDAGVPSAIGTALRGLDPRPSDDPELLPTRLTGKRALVVLDNCEHVSEAVAHVVRNLAIYAPSVSVVATSQSPLSIEHQTIIHIPLMEAAKDAVRLFLDRAPGLHHASSEMLERISAICSHLDGLPLAIELAARRTAFLSVSQIESLLEDRFRLLVSKNREHRHGTLENTIGWSYDLLPPEEQAAFRAISAFRGAFDAELAAHVIGVNLLEAVDLLEPLVERSLLTNVPQEIPEFRMLESVRGFGEKKLDEAGERQAVQDRHSEAMEKFCVEIYGHFDTAKHSTALDQIDRRIEDVVAAIDHSMANPSLRYRAVRIAGRMGMYWWYRSRFTFAREVSVRVLPYADSSTPEGLYDQANCMAGVGIAAWSQADYEEAERYQRSTADIYRKLGDKRRLASSLSNLALTLSFAGRLDEARQSLEEMLREFGGDGSSHIELRAQISLATYAYDNTEYEEALRLLTGVRRHYEADIAPTVPTLVDLNMAKVLTLLGRLEEAEEVFEIAFEQVRSSGSHVLLAAAYVYHSYLMFEVGDYAHATWDISKSLENFSAIGERRGIMYVFEAASVLAARTGECEAALRFFGAAVSYRRKHRVTSSKQLRAARRPWIRACLRSMGSEPRRPYLEGKAMPDSVTELKRWLESKISQPTSV